MKLFEKCKMLKKALREKKWLNYGALAFFAVIFSFVYQVMIEFVRMRSVTSTLNYLEPRLPALLLGTGFLAIVYIFITLLTRQLWIATVVEGVILLAAAGVNYFKLQYRGEPLIPRDLLSISEAADIARGLKLSITRELILFVVIILVFTLVSAFFSLPKARSTKGLVIRTLCLLIAFPLASYLYLFGVLGNDSTAAKAKLAISEVGQATTAYKNTFVTSFIYLTTRLMPSTPQNYSETEIEQIVAQIDGVAADEETQKDVIVILLETYFQFPEDGKVSFSAPMTENFDRLAAEGVSGTMLSDSFGGGTANIEFSVDTGFCNAFLPAGAIPFAEFVTDDFPCYSNYLKSSGYTTGSVHAYYDYFYSRASAYPKMGIEQSIWIDSFVNPMMPNGYVSEMDSMQMLAESYEEKQNTAPGQPIYLKCVTMQNHCDYMPGGYTGENPISVTAPGLGDEQRGSLETMASNLRDVDEAIGWICDYFAGVDRDVVLVFYGDHLSDPDISVLSDYVYADLSGDAQYMALHSTPFLIWSNTQKCNEQIEPVISPWQIVPLAVQRYGVVHPLYYDFLNEMRGEVAAYSNGYVVDGEGNVSAAELTQAQEEWLKKQELLQYDLIFGKKYGEMALFGNAG